MNNQYTPKETIRRSLINFPSLYQEPADVLHHLFAVIGNGFEWVNGHLINSWEDERDDPTQWIQDQIDDAADSPSLKLYYRKMMHTYQFTKDNMEDILEHGDTRYAGTYYPLSQYSRILCVPDDVSNEWLKAAYQFASDALVAFRMQFGVEGAQTQKDFKTYEELALKYDDMLISRGVHSTYAEREELVMEMTKELIAKRLATNME